MKNKVLLVYPGKVENRPPLPLAPLHLAAHLVRHGFDPVILDTRISNIKDLDLNDFVAVGISCMTGPQVGYGLDVARFVKNNYPCVPVVWGGVHPTLLPDETVRNRFVDIVVRGEGEGTMVELVNCLLENNSLQEVHGITYKENGEIKHNPERSFMDLNTINPLPYHLLDLSCYASLSEYIPYQLTRGCPHNCTFCYNHKFNKRRWRRKDVGTIIRDLRLITQQFRPKRIYFTDDQALVSEKFTQELCEKLISEGMDFNWNTQIDIKCLLRFNPETIRLMKRSGCIDLGVGVESGSQRILEIIQKPQRAEDALKAAKKMNNTGIKLVFNFMFGFPDETEEDVQKTFRMINQLVDINNNISFKPIWVLIPYPGTKMFDLAVKRGYSHPKSLEEWDGYGWGSIERLPWLSRRRLKKLNSISNMTRYDFFKEWSPKGGLLSSILNLDARLRWKYQFFLFPLEWKIRQKLVHFWRGKGTI